jgi:hypothetical protein
MLLKPLEHKQAAAKTRISLAMVAICSLCALLGLLAMEAMLSTTALITPIDQALVYVTWTIGLLLGLTVSFSIHRQDTKSFGLYHKVAMMICAPAFFWVIADSFAWRIADRLTFGFFSQAPFAPAIYPVTDANRPWKGQRAHIEINPFNLKRGVAIAVPNAQYEGIEASFEGLCVAVLQRRSANGAIHVATNGRYTWFEPKSVKLSACLQKGPPSRH